MEENNHDLMVCNETEEPQDNQSYENEYDVPEQNDDELADEMNQEDEEVQLDQSTIPVDGIGMMNASNANGRMSVDDSWFDYREHRDGYPSRRKVASQSSPISRKSMDDADPRMQKIAQTEANIREEMFRECTFRPKIKNLPTSYGPLKENGTPFVARVSKWEKEKKADLENKAKLLVKESEVECTFKPHINKNSARELHKESPDQVSDRLFKRYVSIRNNRQMFIEQELQKEQMLTAQQCTFKPHLKTNPQFQLVQSKFKHVINSPNAAKVEEVMYKECSFIPKINRIKPNMSRAKVYVKTDAERLLTKPIYNEPAKKLEEKHLDDSFEDGQVTGSSTYISSLQSGNQSNESFKTPESQTSRSSAGSIEPTLSNDSDRPQPMTNEADFNNFSKKRSTRVKKREDTLQNTAVTRNFKRGISLKSKAFRNTIHSFGNKAVFLDRVLKVIDKRFDDFLKRRSIPVQKREVTLKNTAVTRNFKRRISLKSKAIINTMRSVVHRAVFLDSKDIEKSKEGEQQGELIIDIECTSTPYNNRNMNCCECSCAGVSHEILILLRGGFVVLAILGTFVCAFVGAVITYFVLNKCSMAKELVVGGSVEVDNDILVLLLGVFVVLAIVGMFVAIFSAVIMQSIIAKHHLGLKKWTMTNVKDLAADDNGGYLLQNGKG